MNIEKIVTFVISGEEGIREGNKSAIDTIYLLSIEEKIMFYSIEKLYMYAKEVKKFFEVECDKQTAQEKWNMYCKQVTVENIKDSFKKVDRNVFNSLSGGYEDCTERYMYMSLSLRALSKATEWENDVLNFVKIVVFTEIESDMMELLTILAGAVHQYYQNEKSWGITEMQYRVAKYVIELGEGVYA